MEIVKLILGWAVPLICGSVVTGCVTYIRTMKKRNSALEDGVQALLRAEIIRQHDKYSERGTCPIYAKEALKREYHAYHALGGNDVATHLYETTLKLPEPKEVK